MSLAKYPMSTMLRCKDMTAQKRFYTEMLGLRIGRTYPTGEIFLEGGNGTQIGLYPGEKSKADHTVVCFQVDDIHAVVAMLKSKGIKLMDYDTPGFKTVDHVVDMEGHRAAWIQDPEGNYIGLGQDKK